MIGRLGERRNGKPINRQSGKGSDDGWKIKRSIKEDRGRVAQIAFVPNFRAILSLVSLG